MCSLEQRASAHRIDGERFVAEPLDDRPYNPYESQTTANTKPDWIYDDGHKDVDANLDGMAHYAKNMKIVADNLRGNAGELDLLGTLPTQAWEGGALPEGLYSRHLLMNNYAEFRQYLAYLQQALLNIGSAAQTIAVSYAGTDGWSAADLNSVNFAYGASEKRPSGYPEAWMNQ